MFLVAELVWITLCGQTSIDSLEFELASLITDQDKLDEAYVSLRSLLLFLVHLVLAIKGYCEPFWKNQSEHNVKKLSCSWVGSYMQRDR